MPQTEAPVRISAPPAPAVPATPPEPVLAVDSRARYVAALALGLLFIALINLVVRHTELVTGRYVSGGVPPVAAFGTLLLFLGARVLLRRFFRLELTRQQLLIIYSMTALGTFLAGSYSVRAFLPHIVSLQYWSRTKTELAPFAAFFPTWLAPTNPEVIRGYFEGSQVQGTPWMAWLLPIGVWLAFWAAMFGAGWCLLLLFRRQWMQHERLAFPLLTLPLALTGGDSRFGSRPLFKNPLLWFGIGGSALFDGLNITHALWPTIPAPGFYYPLTDLFSDRTHAPLKTIWLFFMPEGIGFGYFLPLEVSFSTWFFYLAQKAFAVAALSAGWEGPGLPYFQEQSAGAILAVAVLLVVGNSGQLTRLFRDAFFKPWGRANAEEREARWAWLGFGGCSAFLLWFCVSSGIEFRVALLYLGVLAAFLLVYARMRAETGAPYEFTYPFGLPKDLVIQALSVHGIMDIGGQRSMAMLSAFAWLSRHHPGSMTAAISADSMKLAEVTGASRRRFFGALALALVFGFLASCAIHLSTFHLVGSNLAGGGNGAGEYRAVVALQEFQKMAQQVATTPGRDPVRMVFTGAGAGIALGLALLRRVWMGCPFHPLGFILGTAYGDSTIFFFPLFIAWGLKWMLLRAGGLRLYREGLPFFIGLIVGHFTVAGIVWPVISLFISRDTSAGYQIYFG